MCFKVEKNALCESPPGTPLSPNTAPPPRSNARAYFILVDLKNSEYFIDIYISVASELDNFHVIWDSIASSVKKKSSETFGTQNTMVGEWGFIWNLRSETYEMMIFLHSNSWLHAQ